MDKLAIKKCAKKILLELNDDEITYIYHSFPDFDQKIDELLKLDLSNYQPAFYPCVKNFYELREDKYTNKNLKVKNIFFKLKNNEK